MDTYWSCPSYKCKLMELLPFFLDITENDEDIRISPSRLIYELQLSTEDRLEQLNKPTRKRRTTTNRSTFSRTPDVVVFQNFEPERLYKTTVILQNLKSVSRHLSVEKNTSPFFHVNYVPESSPIKVAPGMTYAVQISFTPIQLKDYIHTVRFITDDETFSVPIYAIGYRSLLNIPDYLCLNSTAVRVPSQKNVALYNFGKVEANYVVAYKEPLKVIPPRGVLKSNQANEMNVICTPVNSSTPIESEIIFMYDDIRLSIPVKCEVVAADIQLNTNTVFFGEVYMHLETYKTVTVHNKSKFCLDFRWKAHKSKAVDLLESTKLLKAMEDMTEMEKKKYARLEYMNIIDAEGHSRILDKNLEEESEMSDPFLYKSNIFNIIPMDGQIVPNQSLDFTFIFHPRKNDYYTSIAYLDITGKEERLSVSLAGGGKGPDVIFNVTVLNIGNIFLQAMHEYQLVAKNNGLIPATVSFKEKETDFGGIVKCLPKMQHLRCYDHCKSFILSFKSEVQGEFVEKIHFEIEESKEIISVLLVGNVVCPLLKPTVGNIDFGEVSFGFVPVRELYLRNDSQVPVDFKMKVAGKSENAEFEFEPKEGIVDAFSSTMVKVTLRTNAIRNVEEDLIVVMWGSSQSSSVIPLKYNCVCPVIKCTPEEVEINFCFLNYEYKRTITVRNISSNYGYLTYTPIEEPKNMICRLSRKEMIINPEEEIEIGLSIQTDVLGIHEYPLIFTMSGNEPQTICKIKCNGQGPVVSYDPDELNFGKVFLLNDTSETLRLINDSPIEAEINISTRPNSPFVPLVKKLIIGPENTAEVVINCFLTNTGKFRDCVDIDIKDGESMSVSVFAEGVGCSILCQPKLEPEYDVGTLLTYQIFSLPVRFTNLGKKFYKISWLRRQSVKSLKNAKDDDIPSIFRIEPNYFELGYNDTITAELIGYSKKPRVLQEDFHCYATLDKSTKVENVMSCLIKAEFVDPSIEFSKYSLNFLSVDYSCEPAFFSKPSLIPLVDYEETHGTPPTVMECEETNRKSVTLANTVDHEETHRKQVTIEQIVITNDTNTSLNLALKTTSDFFIIEENIPKSSLHYILHAQDMYNAVIEFRPKPENRKYSMKKGRLVIDVCNHPKTNTIPLTGEVCFPTINLYPNQFDFKCIPLNSYSFTNILLQNTTFLPAVFTWELSEDMIEIEELPDLEKGARDVQLSKVPSLSSSSSIIEEIPNETGEPRVKSKSILSSDRKFESGSKSANQEVSMVKRLTLPQTDDIEPPDVTTNKIRKTLTDESPSVVFPQNELCIEWSTSQYEGEARKILEKVVGEFVDSDDDDNSVIFEDVKPESSSASKRIITIEPSRGYLEPYEYILVTVGFYPPPNVKVKCIAACRVDEGEFENLLITGVSSSISYKLSQVVIEFGRQLFCEVCEKSFTLTNTGYADFHFKIIDQDESNDIPTLVARWSNVTPANGFLQSGKSVTLTVKYFPGITEEFKKDIFFEIEYLEHIAVHLHGYAIFSQLILSLPRPSLRELSPVITYTAIASITKKYLLEINDIKSKNFPEYVAKQGRPDDINEVTYGELIDNEWVVLSEKDLYPSTEEIDLSIERKLVNEHILNKDDIFQRHTLTRKTDLIPDFTVPPYTLDFGYIIVDKPVCYTVLILNSGSVCVLVKLVESKNDTLEANGFKIEYQNKKLEVGEMTELYLIFNPTQEKFGIDDKYVEERFQLKLNHGGIVPVAITATVTRPKISVKYTCIDFGTVKSGTVLRKSVVIENNGFLLSEWNVEVRSLSKKIKNAYWVLPESGELEPGKKDLLNIYFTPTAKAFYNSQITIMVAGNSIPIEFQLCGHGTEPTLVFSEHTLEFKKSLPYSQNDRSFLVQNVSTFPIEFCFPDLDQDYEDEKFHAELYLNTYNLKTVLVPERQLGSRSPDIFFSNYISLLDQLRQSTINSTTDYETRESIPDPLAQYTKDEIFLQLRGYLKSSNFENDDTRTDVYVVEDNSQSRIAIIEAEKPVNSDQLQPRNGVFIIFHGAPNTGYYKAANRAGRALCLKVYSIDRLIYDELVKNESQPANEINDVIDAKLQTNKIEVEALPEEDAYDLLLRRIQSMSIASPKKQKSKAAAVKSQRSDKGSDKKNAGKKTKAKDSPSLITIDLIWALLKVKFESVREGIIIESLNSNFMPKTDVALDCLLRAIGCVKFIQVVILSYTLENYMKNEELRLADEVTSKGTESRKQSPKGSEKGSVKSKTSSDKSKQILKNLPKDLKTSFEEFAVFLDETVSKCQTWEKKSQAPLKPPITKVSTTLKLDMKSSTKDSAKDSKTSTRKGKSMSLSNIKYSTGDSSGIRLWIFTNCMDDRYIDSEMLGCLLKNSPELNDAIQDLKRGIVIDVVESSTTFSVFKKSKRKKNIQSEQFRICNGSIEIVKSDCLMNAAYAKKKGTKRKFSADRKSDRVSVSSAVKDPTPTPFQPRSILQPGDILKYQVLFSPTSCGQFSNTYALTILGNDSIHSIQCNAICELPTIDFTPEVMFPKCRDSYSEKMLGDRFTFFKNENVFDFGSIIVGNNKSHPYKTNFTLQNSSDLQCSTTIELNEPSLFSVEPTNLLVEPNESLSVTLSLKALKKGKIGGEMYISIQNNPKVETIKLLAHSCALEFHVSPKLITFDKGPTEYHMKKTISLQNSSPVDLSWKLAKADWVHDIYKLEKTSGEVKLYSCEEIVVGYSPTKEETNPKKNVEVQILDLNHSEIMPIHTESIALQSEALEYIIEYQNHIDLGDRKGKTNYKIPFHLLNKGKCNVNIVFSELDNILPNDMHLIRKLFKLNSHSETLHSQKTTTVIFHFNPTSEMNFKEVPVFSCSFVEIDRPENVIRSFIVTFSGAVHLSKFTMCPNSNMYFGYQQIFSSKLQKLDITNTGKFAFDYKILRLADVLGEQLKEKTTKKKGKTGSDSSRKTSSKKSDAGSGKSKDKSKEKKIVHIVKLDVPGFCLSSSIGTVEPNETVQINVDCNPQKQISYKEDVVIFVSEPLKEDVNGRKLTLHVEGSEPNLNFAEYQKLFKEHFIVEKLEQFKTPENIGAHCIFVISESTLYFRNVCVNEVYQTNVYLQNVGQVIANVSTKIIDTKNNFSVSPSSLSIEPYTTVCIIISFKPDSINKLESKLEISYNACTDNTFSLTIIGESCVPQIKLLKPNVDETNYVSLSFDPTYLDNNACQEIEIQNVGPIPCKVIMDLYDNEREMFSLRPSGDTVSLLNLHGKGPEDTIHSSMVNLLPSQKANFSLIFWAKLAFTVNVKLKIHTVNNPFEIINIGVRAQGFYNDIHLSGLPTFNHNSSISYLLDFGYTSLNRLEKKRFTIRNHSQNSIYKFEFTNVDKLMLTPRVGHLKPSAFKEIIATISTRQQMCLAKVKLECKFIHIDYVEPNEEDISWDDRQQLVARDSNDPKNEGKIQYFQEAISIAKREVLRLNQPGVDEEDREQCIMHRAEPEIKFLTNAWDTIPIFFSITADFASYECKVKELIFPDTYVNQSSEVTFVVRNAGTVPLQIDWVLSCDEILLPKRVSSANFNETKETLLAPAPSMETSVSFVTLFSSESLMGDDPLPFQIFPRQHTIPTMQTKRFRIVFTPLVASQYYVRLLSDIPSLDRGVKNMDISITAESLVPECYFEMDEPGYVGRKLSIQRTGGQDEEGVRVVELCAVGVGVTSTKRFYVMNTSCYPLPFKLKSLDTENRFTFFQCKTPTGCIQPGKKFELAFSFTGQELGNFEERYLFSIDTTNFKALLLIVGKCREPKVYFKKAHIDISATLWKTQSEQSVSLKNEEEFEIRFKFVKSSFYSQDHEQQLVVAPLSETIPAKGEISVRLIYNAVKVGESNFNLKCAIQRQQIPLNLSVTAKCLEVVASVTYTNRDGSKILLDPRTENRIDFGNIGIKMKRELKFQILNAGQTGFFYTWHLNKKLVEYAMNISSENPKAFVPIGDCSQTDLVFEARRKYNLKDFNMKLEISYGPTYVLKINAIAADILCKFSFTNYNFGNCLIQKMCSKYYRAILEVKNHENRPVVLENEFENSDDLTVDFKSVKLTPNCIESIPIYFHPRRVRKFEFSLPILVDSSKRRIKVTGEGVKLNIQLVNPNDKFINFDAVKLGHSKKYRLQIFNKTPTQVDINLNVPEDHTIRIQDEKIEHEIEVPELPPTLKETTLKNKSSHTRIDKHEDTVKKEENKKEDNKKDEIKKSKENLIVTDHITIENVSVKKPKKFLTIHPKNGVLVDSSKKCEFIVEFKPSQRIEKFSDKIHYSVQDYCEPLCIVMGSCIAPEFSLDKSALTFSNVVIGCKHVLNVLLKNTGDTKGRFKWSFGESSGDFKLYPTEGFITPKSEMRVWVSFEPNAIHCQILKNVKCIVDGTTLNLQLIASSTDLPQPLGTVSLSCPVRTTTAGQFTIVNNTKVKWCLKPIVSDKSFSVPSEITVLPESSSNVEVQYSPKQMFGIQPDKVTLFLPLPDGQAIIYDLVGNVLPPLPINRIEVVVKCKQNYSETLLVENWLEVKQCFEVKTQLLSIPTTKTLYKAFGHNLIEVPPNSHRNYKWNIYVINEESVDFKVVFTNIETQEYVFYEISVKVLPSGPLETISLTCRVREHAKKTIKLKNPINVPVTFNINSILSELQYDRIIRLEPYSVHDLVITYCPLTTGEVLTNLDAKCEELGVFTYVLKLRGTPPPLEKVLRFKAELGHRGYNYIYVKNTFTSPFELSSTFDHAVFSTEKSGSVLLEETQKFTIKFEPSELGTVESRAVFTSSVTGDYVYPLIGECVLPTPKGPFFVKPGGTAQIPFFNPFIDQKKFDFLIDSNLFLLKSTSDMVKARKSTKIIVTLPSTRNLDVDLKYPITARLIVMCGDADLRFIKWIFYIQSDR